PRGWAVCQAAPELVAHSGKLQRDLCRRYGAALHSHYAFSAGTALVRPYHPDLFSFRVGRLHFHPRPLPCQNENIVRHFACILLSADAIGLPSSPAGHSPSARARKSAPERLNRLSRRENDTFTGCYWGGLFNRYGFLQTWGAGSS